jgi:hypothetical protein
MGKRSNFERREKDAYQTPPSAVIPLIPFLHGVKTFAEPCEGEGKLVKALEEHGLKCTFAADIDTGFDATKDHDEDFNAGVFDAIITNPPWRRDILHPMIERFQSICPTWLLFDADWAHTKQARPYLQNCSHIVSIGRVKWIEDSKMTGKDNCAFYRFHIQHNEGPRFYNLERQEIVK